MSQVSAPRKKYVYPPKPLEDRKPRLVLTPETIITEEKVGNLTYTYADGVSICGAKVHVGRYHICINAPTKNRNRCWLHGGKTPRGLKLPQSKSLRYGKDLPDNLKERYEEALSDPNLLELKEEIAILETLIGTLLKRLDTGESGKSWKDLEAAYEDLRMAAMGGDPKDFAAALNDMGAIINSNKDNTNTWNEITKAIRGRKTLVESERRRLIEMNQIITTEQAMTLITFLVSVVKSNVTDPIVLSKISGELTTYLQSNRHLIKS